MPRKPFNRNNAVAELPEKLNVTHTTIQTRLSPSDVMKTIQRSRRNRVNATDDVLIFMAKHLMSMNASVESTKFPLLSRANIQMCVENRKMPEKKNTKNCTINVNFFKYRLRARRSTRSDIVVLDRQEKNKKHFARKPGRLTTNCTHVDKEKKNLHRYVF